MTVQNHRPKIAIIDPNTLATLGLKQLLLNMMPIVTVDTFGTLAELKANDADIYAHYFVSLDIVLANRAYFVERRRKTIVLTLSLTDSTQPSEFNTLCINQPEPQLVRQLLALEQHAHGHGQNLPIGLRILNHQFYVLRGQREGLAAAGTGFIYYKRYIHCLSCSLLMCHALVLSLKITKKIHSVLHFYNKNSNICRCFEYYH